MDEEQVMKHFQEMVQTSQKLVTNAVVHCKNEEQVSAEELLKQVEKFEEASKQLSAFCKNIAG